jgi:membrane associated rhomboid family serine protease
MLSDRSYMRETRDSSSFDVIKWLMGIFVALFLLQHVAERWLGFFGHYKWLGLSGDAVLHGHKVWALFTYSFLQDTSGADGGIFNLIFGLLGLYFFGGAVRGIVGTGRFVWLYSAFIVAGAAAWLAVYPLGATWPLLGPLSVLSGIFALYCCYHADEQMTFLAFFIVPVTAKPKYFCWFWVALDLICFLFYEMMGRHSPMWNGSAANLAAMLVAYGYYRISARVDLFGGSSGASIELPRWFRRRKKDATPRFQVNLTNRNDLRIEVDRILDKINSEGFGALTQEEKRLLDEARDLLSRH